MPKLTRPDGVEISWRERGQGPLIVISVHTFAYPDALQGLIAELAQDQRVVTYDARGTGDSTRRGPYDLGTDRDDLGALIEALGGPALLLAWGDSAHRAVVLAADRPQLAPVVVLMGGGGGVVTSEEAAGADAMGGSEAVQAASREQLRNDYRGALRYSVAITSPQLSEDQIRERVDRGVAYCSQEAAVARFENWDPTPEVIAAAQGLGGRLWVIQFPTTWWPRETIEMVRERLPEAHVIGLDDSDGPLSQPALTAGVVRAAARPLRAGG